MAPSFADITAPYDAFIIDLWGVVHDGTAMYPGALEALEYLHTQKKPVLFLSNAPRLSVKAQENLDRLSVPRDYYRGIITSGQVAHDLLAVQEDYLRYYYLGPSKDEAILDDLPNFEPTEDVSQAQFILCTGYEEDFQPHEDIIPTLLRLKPLPMICVNPDMEVVKQDGTHMLCAGSVAAEYLKQGGRVSFIGKPMPEVYNVCRKILPEMNLLAIGDNPVTDIKGANDAGIDSLLITGGVLKAQYGKELTAEALRLLCATAGVKAQHVLPAFSL